MKSRADVMNESLAFLGDTADLLLEQSRQSDKRAVDRLLGTELDPEFCCRPHWKWYEIWSGIRRLPMEAIDHPLDVDLCWHHHFTHGEDPCNDGGYCNIPKEDLCWWSHPEDLPEIPGGATRWTSHRFMSHWVVPLPEDWEQQLGFDEKIVDDETFPDRDSLQQEYIWSDSWKQLSTQNPSA